MDKRIEDLYHEYTHGLLDRREFLKKLSVIAGSVAVANTLLPVLEGGSSKVQGATMEDRVVTENIEYPGATGAVRAKLAMPKGDAYAATMNLSMAGPWNIVVKITAGGKTGSLKFTIDAK